MYSSCQKVENRASNGFAVLIAYTYSKSLDNQGGYSDTARSSIQNDNNPNADYAVSDFNLGQTLVVSPMYQLPFGRGQRFLGSGRYVNMFAGGWEVTAIVTATSGPPFTVTASQDYSNTGSSSPRPDRVCKGTGPKKVTDWFNLNCFSTVALAQALANGTPRFGTSGRGILTAPGVQNWDIGLNKTTNITDRVNAEFKVQFFNAFNHTDLGSPDAVIGSGEAGIISGAGSARDLQLAVKLKF